jgi:hypothetical protein
MHALLIAFISDILPAATSPAHRDRILRWAVVCVRLFSAFVLLVIFGPFVNPRLAITFKWPSFFLYAFFAWLTGRYWFRGALPNWRDDKTPIAIGALLMLVFGTMMWTTLTR